VLDETDALKSVMTASWDAGARAYDAAPRHGLRHADEFVAWRRLVAAILGDPSHAPVPRLRVLDVGTGTGVMALLAAELGHEVVGIDLAPGMLAEARRKAALAGLAIDFRQADAEDLPVGLAGFDAVLARHLVWTLPCPDRALTAWRSAARGGGLIAVIDGTYPPRALPVRLAAGLAGRWVGWRHGDGAPNHEYPAATYARLPLSRQRDTAPVAALMRSAGLERIRVRTVPEVDRIERAHLAPAERLADGWRRYLATGRVPVLVAEEAPPAASAGSPASGPESSAVA
jgi:ubiquinone/menaquinone biosynthesis C-methylase UbiE